jgi:abortive infection bacteriophage resistance protein
MSADTSPALKTPTTYDEQAELLRSRGLIIPDMETATQILRNLNYYRFTAYLLPFRKPDSEEYVAGTTFARVYDIYEFDRHLRNLIVSALEPIEVMMRTRIAYFHAHKYGAGGYMDAGNFEDATRHEEFIEEFNSVIAKNAKSLVVQHHQMSYGGRFPIWVAVEFFSFGMLSRFYGNMKPEDRRQVAHDLGQGPEHLRSWLHCLTYLRNMCAHYTRLYYLKMMYRPRPPKDNTACTSGRVFDIIFVMKYLYPDRGRWSNVVLRQLQALAVCVGKMHNKEVVSDRFSLPA